VERQRSHPREPGFFERGLALSQGNLAAERDNAAVVLRNSEAWPTSRATTGPERSTSAARSRSARRSESAAARAGLHHGRLGNALRGLDREEEARALYRQALEAQQRAFSPDHPALAIGFHNLAASLLEGGQSPPLSTRRSARSRSLAGIQARGPGARGTRGAPFRGHLHEGPRHRDDRRRQAPRRSGVEQDLGRGHPLARPGAGRDAERHRPVKLAGGRSSSSCTTTSTPRAAASPASRSSDAARCRRTAIAPLLDQARGHGRGRADARGAQRALPPRAGSRRGRHGAVSEALPKDAALVGYVRFVRFEEVRGRADPSGAVRPASVAAPRPTRRSCSPARAPRRGSWISGRLAH